MTTYIVTLHLKQTSVAPYSKISEEFLRLKGHWVKDTTWLVDVRQTAPELKRHLARYLARDEIVYLAKLTSGHEFCRLPGLTREWINRHPPLR